MKKTKIPYLEGGLIMAKTDITILEWTKKTGPFVKTVFRYNPKNISDTERLDLIENGFLPFMDRKIHSKFMCVGMLDVKLLRKHFTIIDCFSGKHNVKKSEEKLFQPYIYMLFDNETDARKSFR